MDKKNMRKKCVVKESLLLSECLEGFDIHVPYRHKGHWSSIGYITISKIKPIGKGLVQLKYTQQFYSSKKILKVDLPGSMIVERTRDAVPGDPEYIPPEMRNVIFEREGVNYERKAPVPDLTPSQEMMNKFIGMAVERSGLSELIPPLYTVVAGDRLMGVYDVPDGNISDLTLRRII